MKVNRSFLLLFCLFLFNSLAFPNLSPQSKKANFVHPGINFTLEDLNLMKDQVSSKKNPWYDAYNSINKNIYKQLKNTVHIVSGPYSNPDIGGRDLKEGARSAYYYALLWYISDNDLYAEKSIALIKNWVESGIWSFDENNAKLLAAQVCYYFCNAAEILRYTYKKWDNKLTEDFSRFMMSSFYPLLRYYFPRANGNWDAGIIRALMSLSIFTENRDLFNNTIQHYKYSHANGSLFKYIYPDGQCQESTRDQGHVQMGLEYFAGVARIAYSQGIDLFTIADNRLALGFEYTSKYLLGNKVHSYGVISPHKRSKVSSDYIYVLNFYNSLGINMPYANKLLHERILPKADGWDILTSYRANIKSSTDSHRRELKPSQIAFQVGAQMSLPTQNKQEQIKVYPGESIQDAIDKAVLENKIVVLMPGQHLLTQTLELRSNLHLMGYGKQTVLMGGNLKGFSAISTSVESGLQNVILENFLLEAAYSYATEPQNTQRFERTDKFSNALTGIILSSTKQDGYKNIVLKNVTVNDYSRNGVFLAGIHNLSIIDCDFSDNGAHTVPGPRLQHNLKLTHVSNVKVHNSRFDTSIKGCGLYVEHSQNLEIDSCEIARNAWYGLLITESQKVSIKDCLIEGNDDSGICLPFQFDGSNDVYLYQNLIRFNAGFGVASYMTKHLRLHDNLFDDNLKGNTSFVNKPVLLLEDINNQHKTDE